MREQILYYAIIYDGDWKKIARAIKQKEPWKTVKYDCAYVTIVDEEYPERLRRLQYAPWILFYEGDLALVNKHTCGIVGSRKASAFGYTICSHITNILKEKYVIVSGLAKGIDGCAHYHALDHKTIGVIGCGLDMHYPDDNASLYTEMKKRHLIVSEYPLSSPPYAYHFPWRNRIIAALSDAVVVVEATKRSGSMLTVNEALNLDVPVYCIPHAFHDHMGDGSNFLIAQGANILVDDEDIRMI